MLELVSLGSEEWPQEAQNAQNANLLRIGILEHFEPLVAITERRSRIIGYSNSVANSV